MRISDWSSDVCSSDLHEQIVDGRNKSVSIQAAVPILGIAQDFHDVLVPKDGINRPSGIRVIRLRWNIEAGENIALHHRRFMPELREQGIGISHADPVIDIADRHEVVRSEEHTSELKSLMRNSYAVFCLTKKHKKIHTPHRQQT